MCFHTVKNDHLKDQDWVGKLNKRSSYHLMDVAFSSNGPKKETVKEKGCKVKRLVQFAQQKMFD